MTPESFTAQENEWLQAVIQYYSQTIPSRSAVEEGFRVSLLAKLRVANIGSGSVTFAQGEDEWLQTIVVWYLTEMINICGRPNQAETALKDSVFAKIKAGDV